MASLSELQSVRREKMAALRAAGMNPFAVSVPHTHSLAEIRSQFVELSESHTQVSVVGRVMSIRGQGAILFVTLQDGTGSFQVVIKKDSLSESLFTLFSAAIDLADSISVTGIPFTTQRGEPSIEVTDWVIATKSLLPLPDKVQGIQDEELKTRKRYIDAIMDPDVYNRFITRSKIISYIRNYFDTRGFMEIETPILQNQAGGAMAETFNTFHNDYDMPMVLRISLELEHKMMMVAGYPKIYEIGKNFRNEGTDPTHMQEFTMIEWYAAYHTLTENMNWTQELLQGLARDIVGREVFTVYDKSGNATEVSFAGEWPRVNFGDLLLEKTGLNVATATTAEVRAAAIEWGMDAAEAAITGRGNLLDHVFKKSVRAHIIHPTFVMRYPSELKPLAQQNADGTAEVAQLIIGGAEITNQYAELVDPDVQRALLVAQSAAKAAGDKEAMEIDERFLEAMEHGMPPMTGFGMGIDRIVAILTDQKNLRDTIFFPIMKTKSE